MRKKFEEDLRKSLKQYGGVDHSSRNLEETLTRVKCVYASKIPRPRISYGQFLLRQLQFTGGRIWAFQAVVLIVLCMLIYALLSNRYAEIDFRQLVLLLEITAVLSAMTGVPYICRSFRYGMYETETASKVSYSGLLLARLLLTGVGNLIMLSVIFAAAYLENAALPVSTVIYMIVPFAVAWAGCLTILKHVCSQRTHLYCAAFSVSLIPILFMLYKAFPELFAREMADIWFVVCIAVIAGLLIQARALIKKSSRMDGVSMQ